MTEGCIAALRWRYPAKPGRALPCIRRGRCSHRPANPAISQTPCGGRDRPPYIAAGSEWQRISTSLPPGPSAGRCSHRPGNLATPQTSCGGRDRPPYIVAGAWRQRINASLPPGPCAEGRHPFKKNHKTKEHAKPLRRGAALHNRHPPAMPAVPGLASHRIRAAAKPACAAGEGMV